MMTELGGRYYETDDERFLTFYMEMFRTKHILDQPVTLSLFIPCENGKPLEKPINYKECGIQTQIACSQELEPCECAALGKYKERYQKACEAVLFEGWELVSNDLYNSGVRVVEIKNKDWQIQFYYGGSYEGTISLMQDVPRPLPENDKPLLNDLAEATTENPIKLKQ